MSLEHRWPPAALALIPGALAARDYTVAFASFAPLAEDVFIAAGDGSEPVPLAPYSALDYNASFSADGYLAIKRDYTVTSPQCTESVGAIKARRAQGQGTAQTEYMKLDERGMLVVTHMMMLERASNPSAALVGPDCPIKALADNRKDAHRDREYRASTS
jgi:hypothetical protein